MVRILPTASVFVFLLASVWCWSQTTREEPRKSSSNAASQACCSCLESLKLVVQTNQPHEIPSGLKAEVDPDDPNDRVMTVRPGKKVPSNKFQVLIEFSTKPSEKQGNLTLQWFERADRLPPIYETAGLKPDKWNDIQDSLTTSQAQVRKADGLPPQPGDKPGDLTTVKDYVESHGGTLTYWPRQYLHKKAMSCSRKQTGNHSQVYIEDQPSAPKPRKLDFHIVVKDPDHCGCQTPKILELYATQLIRSRSGKADDPADPALSRIYGPNGEVVPERDNIPGQAPNASEPKLP